MYCFIIMHASALLSIVLNDYNAILQLRDSSSMGRESLVVHPWQKQGPQSDTKQFLRIRVNTCVECFAEIGARRQLFLFSILFRVY